MALSKEVRSKLYEIRESIYEWDKKSVAKLSHHYEQLVELCEEHNLAIEEQIDLKSIPSSSIPPGVTRVGIIAGDIKGNFLITGKNGLEIVRKEDLSVTEYSRLRGVMRRRTGNVKDEGTQVNCWVTKEVSLALMKYLHDKGLSNRSEAMRSLLIQLLRGEGYLK